MKRNYVFEQYLWVLFTLVLFFYMASGLIKAISLGLFVALVAYPLQRKLCSKLKLGHNLGALVLTLSLLIGFILPLSVVGVQVVKDTTSVTQYLFELAQGQDPDERFVLLKFSDLVYSKVKEFVPISQEEWESGLRVGLTSLGSLLTGFLGILAASIPQTILGVSIFLLSLFFGLADGGNLARLIKRILPFDQDLIVNFASTTEKISRGVAVGSVLTGLAQGIIVGSAFWILGVPRPFLFGTLTGFLSFIPFVGSVPTGLGGTLYLYFSGEVGGAIAMVVAFCTASLLDNFIKPWVLQGQVAIHPFIALVSVLGGLAVFGFAGLFLGPLIAALTIAMLDMLATSPKTQSADPLG